jgi:hypothetical protein
VVEVPAIAAQGAAQPRRIAADDRVMEPSAPAVAHAARCRWAGIGRSADPDPVAAAAAATHTALAGGDDPRLLLVFAVDGQDFGALVAAVDDVSGGVPLVGCSSARELTVDGSTDDALVVIALGGAGFAVSTTAVPDAVEDPRDAGARAAACLGDVADRPHRILLLLTDGTIADQPEVIRGAYSVAGAGVPIAGGVTGDAQRPQVPVQFHGRQVHRRAVVGVAIGSDAPLGLGVRHGLAATGEPMLVTCRRPGRVLGLDGRPAAEVLSERGEGRVRSLGLHRRVGEANLRMAVLDDDPDGGVQCNVPSGALLWTMRGDRDAMLAASDAACRDAVGALGDHDPVALILFDCTARRDALGADGTAEQVRRIAVHAGAAAVGGFVTDGEIARTHGPSGFHNQTLVVLALA